MRCGNVAEKSNSIMVIITEGIWNCLST